MPDTLTLDISKFTTCFRAEPGSLFIVSCPIGVRTAEVEAAAQELSDVLQTSGATAIFISAGMKVEVLVDEAITWLGNNDLVLRGYVVPGSSKKETRFRVLHQKLGQLSDESHWFKAIQVAQAAMGPQKAPPAPVEPDSKVAPKPKK